MSTELHRYYDEDTGTDYTLVPTNDYDIRPLDVIQRQREYMQRKAAIESGGIRNYVASYHEPILRLLTILNITELGAVMKLLPYMRMDSAGSLMLGKKRMGIVEIASSIGKARRWTIDTVGSLTKLGVLSEEREGRRNVYAISSEYHTIGSVVNGGAYTKVYQVKTRTDVTKLTVQAAGLLYSMIPFIHFERLFLCANPNVREPDDIRHITQAVLARAIGVEEQTVTRGMKELTRAGFVMRAESFGATVIMMNPDVMYRKRHSDDDYTDHIRYLFTQAELASRPVLDAGTDDLPY